MGSRGYTIKGREYPYYWRVSTRLPERRGQPVRVIALGKMNSALFEFEDGHRVVSSRNYYRRRRDGIRAQ